MLMKLLNVGIHASLRDGRLCNIRMYSQYIVSLSSVALLGMPVEEEQQETPFDHVHLLELSFCHA